MIEVDYDKVMMRTCRRPLPLQKINKAVAFSICMGLFGGSNLIFYHMFPHQAMFVANSIFAMYVFMYTPMKRHNPSNTALGAIVGALPPYLGWTAAGGSVFDLEPLLQFGYMFAWQFSHFYGILFRYKQDYLNAGFKMLFDSDKATFHM